MSFSYIPVSLRRQIKERADGRYEYCVHPEEMGFASHEVDHIIAQKYGGLTELDNLALSCVLCNKYKGSDIASLDPITRKLVSLYHSRRELWSDHFQLDETQILPLTSKGRVTVRILQLNHPDRVIERGLLIKAGLFNAPE